MNLPSDSLCFNTKSQESSVTHQCLSVNCSAAANLRPVMTSALPFHFAQGCTEPSQPTPKNWFRCSTSAYGFLVAFTCEWGSSPSAAEISQSNMAPRGGTGLGGLPGGKKKSVVNAQLKMNIRREINVAYERFPSYLKTESLTSYSG